MEFAEADYDVQKPTGLEFWFTPNLKEGSSSIIPLNPPSWYKMAIVTIPVIVILLLTLVPPLIFYRNAINSLCSKTCHRYHDNSSANELSDNTHSTKNIKILVFQVLVEILIS